MQMSTEDLNDLRCAKQVLENPSLAAKVTNIIGSPIEKGFDLLPGKWSEAVSTATKKALEIALDLALMTLDRDGRGQSRNIWHKLAVVISGGTGGALGLPGLIVELPVSTGIMLRSIADIARGEGERLNLPEVKLACIEVFALGGRTSKDDASESGVSGLSRWPVSFRSGGVYRGKGPCKGRRTRHRSSDFSPDRTLWSHRVREGSSAGGPRAWRRWRCSDQPGFY